MVKSGREGSKQTTYPRKGVRSPQESAPYVATSTWLVVTPSGQLLRLRALESSLTPPLLSFSCITFNQQRRALELRSKYISI